MATPAKKSAKNPVAAVSTSTSTNKSTNITKWNYPDYRPIGQLKKKNLEKSLKFSFADKSHRLDDPHTNVPPGLFVYPVDASTTYRHVPTICIQRWCTH